LIDVEELDLRLSTAGFSTAYRSLPAAYYEEVG
jgi:hypothetical protein